MLQLLFWLYLIMSVGMVIYDCCKSWEDSILVACFRRAFPIAVGYLVCVLAVFPVIYFSQYVIGVVRNRRNRKHA